MSTFLSIHNVKKIAAGTVWTKDNGCTPHIGLEFEGDNFEHRGSVTLYLEDAVLNERLIAAINRIVAERRVELAMIKDMIDAHAEEAA